MTVNNSNLNQTSDIYYRGFPQPRNIDSNDQNQLSSGLTLNNEDDGVNIETAKVTTDKVEDLEIFKILQLDKPTNISFSGIDHSKEKRNFSYIKEKLMDPYIRVSFSSSQKFPCITFEHHEKEVLAIIDQCDIARFFDTAKHIALSAELMTPCTTPTAGSTMFHVYEGYSEYKKRENSLLKFGAKWLATQRTKQISIRQELQNESANEVLLNLVDNHEGVCIGEEHSDIFPKQLIIDNLTQLKAKGVNKIYMEHLFFDSMQPLLDAYFNQKSDEMPSYLKRYLLRCLHSKSFFDLVQAAKKAGIRIVAIDTTVSYNCGVESKVGVISDQNRYIAMNTVATIIINREQKKDPGKYIALMGSGHVAMINNGETTGVPGVAELLQVPSFVIFEMQKEEITFNTSGPEGLTFAAVQLTHK